MSSQLNRRNFLQRSVLTASSSGLAFGFEELLLRTRQEGQQEPSRADTQPRAGEGLPKGKIGALSVSRLICGGNLISGFAHSRDLIYVSPLVKRYFTDDKALETLQLCEAHGINTAILRVDEQILRILRVYWQEQGGKIQWIAQAKITETDMKDIELAVGHGAVGVYVHGGVADSLVERGQLDVLAAALENIKKSGVLAGVAGHSIAVPKAVVRAGLDPDFFMKTFNSKRYWSAGPEPRHDSVWEETPEETKAFMASIKKPWIAYKVLGAGAIHPREGFAYAYQNGADFICAGMFDFQVSEDVRLAKQALEEAEVRERPWCA